MLLIVTFLLNYCKLICRMFNDAETVNVAYIYIYIYIYIFTQFNACVSMKLLNTNW